MEKVSALYSYMNPKWSDEKIRQQEIFQNSKAIRNVTRRKKSITFSTTYTWKN
jgi:hypothetical protein